MTAIFIFLLLLIVTQFAAAVDCVPTGTGTQDCTFALKCQDNSLTEMAFIFQRKSDGVAFADLLPFSGIDQCAYTDAVSGDTGGRTYTWRAFAQLLDGSRLGPSNEASMTTPAILPPPKKCKGKKC